MNPSLTRHFIGLGGAVTDEIIRLGSQVVLSTQDATEMVGTLDYTPGIEEVAHAGADLVVADLAVVSMDVVTALRDEGLEVETVDSSSIKRTAGMIRQLGTFTGNKTEATRLANDLEGKLNDHLDRLAYTHRPVVLALSWPDPLTGCGPASLIHDILWTAGLANCLSGYAEPWPELDEGMYLGADLVLTLPFFDDWDAFTGYAHLGELGVILSTPQAITRSGRFVFEAVDAMAPLVRHIHQLINTARS